MRGINTLPVKRRLNKLLHVLDVPQEQRWRHKPKREKKRVCVSESERERDKVPDEPRSWKRLLVSNQRDHAHAHPCTLTLCAVSLHVPFPESTYINGYNGWAMATSTVRPPLSTPSAEYGVQKLPLILETQPRAVSLPR